MKQILQKQLQVGFDTLMCMCVIKRQTKKKKIKLLKPPGYDFEISLLVECMDSVKMGVHKNKSDGQNCV